MLACGGSLISHQNLGSRLCSTRILQLSSLMVKLPSSSSATAVAIVDTNFQNHRFHPRFVSSSSLQSKSTGDIPFLPDSFSQQEDDNEKPPEALSSVAGGIVALGKFDALHIGHRELAIQASKVGTPYLLSFVGMAEVLGWEPRPPIVAQCDRERVLTSWAQYCGNVPPKEFQVQFTSVRHLSPRQFVEKLAKELGVCGVVAGENYRFGYKAAGDASELVRLCDEFGMGAYIINSVMDRHQDVKNMNRYDLKDKGQVSSTRVRQALAEGDMRYVSDLLGRPHRLLLMIKDQESLTSTGTQRVSAAKSSLLNLPPKDGFYENCSLLFGEREPVTCRVSIDTTHIHLEMDRQDFGDYDFSRKSQVRKQQLPYIFPIREEFIWLEEEYGENLIFHTFSNTGWLTYGAILEKFQKQDPSLMGRIRGCIVDSAPVASPDPQVWASGFSAAFLKKRSVATKGLSEYSESFSKKELSEHKPAVTEAALLVVLEKFFEVVLNFPGVNRRLSDVLALLSSGQPTCPHLYIYGSADRVIPANYVESFIEKQKRSGIEVRACNFVSTLHDHFRNDPKLYTSQLSRFLEDCVLTCCKDS